MKHRFRKLTSIFIVLVMVIGVVTITPFTASAYTSATPNYYSAVSSYSELTSRLNSLISKYQDTNWTSNGVATDSSGTNSLYYYGIQCNGFAKLIFNDLFNCGSIGSYDSNKYYYPNANGAYLIDKSWNFGSGDTSTVKGILSQGDIGDFIQVRRRGKTYGHSMILASKDDNGIWTFDCNSDGKCGVRYYYQTWATFASNNIGMSLYRANNYPLDRIVDNYVDLDSDFYAYIINTNSWKPLVNDGSHNACFNYDVYENQKIWHFIKKSNGSYKIISLFDNNTLDVDLGKSESETDVGVWTDTDTTNQEWFIYGSSAQFYLKPNCSDCVLDMTGGKYYDGVNAQIFTKNGTDAQLFQIWKIDSKNIPVDVGSDFYAYIINTAEWKSLSNDGNHNACFEDNLGKNNKVWHFIKKPNGSYKILSILDNNALDVDLGKSESETDVGVWTDTDTTNQEWFIYGSSAQFYLKPNCSDCVLDMTGGKYYDGVNAQIFTKNGTDAQLFQIWKVDIVGDFSISSTVDGNIVNLDWIPSNNAEGYKVNIWNTDSIEDTLYCSYVTTNTHISKELPTGNYRVCVFSYNSSSERASNIIYITIKDVVSSIDLNFLGFDLSLFSNSYTYDGKAKTPTVTVKNDTTTLVENTDYTVEYSNNTNAGTATVTITGMGSYTGTLTKTFTINKASQTLNATIASNTINVGDTSKITASGQGTISYLSSNTNVATINSSGVVTGISAGTATITVTVSGNSNYKSASKTITISVQKSYVLGDIDGDGEVNIIDATLIQNYLVQLISFNDEQLKVADTNGDGWVDITDVTQIQKYLAEIIPFLG